MNPERIKNYETKKEEEWTVDIPFDIPFDKMYSQLDSIWIRDEKDGNVKRKYRESAGSYVRKVHEDGLVPVALLLPDGIVSSALTLCAPIISITTVTLRIIFICLSSK